jgi:hypothetical protein
VKALFVELPAFARHRPDYLDDEGFRGLQNTLLDNPEAGNVIKGHGWPAQGALRRCTAR